MPDFPTLRRIVFKYSFVYNHLQINISIAGHVAQHKENPKYELTNNNLWSESICLKYKDPGNIVFFNCTFCRNPYISAEYSVIFYFPNLTTRAEGMQLLVCRCNFLISKTSIILGGCFLKGKNYCYIANSNACLT